MRYLVTARVKANKAAALADAIDRETLGRGSIAGDEYLRDMAAARQDADGRVRWVEVCFCSTPLAEEVFGTTPSSPHNMPLEIKSPS